MKFIPPLNLRLLFVVSAIFILNHAAAQTDSPREHLSLDVNWKFHLGDDWPNALRLDKAGASGGPAAEKFNDTAWRSLDLPHDWAIELPFDKSADTSHGFKPVGPNFPKNSIGWYRRTFDLPSADAGKRIWLTFDGVFRDATVWVNGWLVKRHEGGYYPFREDITDVAHFGGKNTVTVKVDASKFEGWFYEGAGIYRHVWLDKTAPVAIAPDGIFVRSEFKDNLPESDTSNSPARLHIETRLVNSQDHIADVTVGYEVVSPEGTVLKRDNHGSATAILPNSTTDVNRVGDLRWFIPKPEFWSPENPKLYKLVTTVNLYSDKTNTIVDRKETEFGIRTFAFDPTNGFLLNGKPYVLKGTCNHQDMAGVGAALPDALQYFRVAKLKEFGCNAYRTSHNPPTPELLDACDRLGMIVMDESRLLGSDEENLRKWKDQILRDRNHASIGIWSVANEEFNVQATPQGGNVARTMQDFVKQLDPTRPVTYAAPQGDTFDGINGVIDVRGWNYHIGKKPEQYGKEMDSYRARHPGQPEVGTEQGSTVSTRGIYENDKQRGYLSAYDVNAPSWANTAEEWWSIFAERPWLSGGFVWTGFDYRGEPTPYAWPCINSHFGILDTCGFPKDIFYYYQSWWTTNLVLHLLPHWNWPGKTEIRVDALSNCEEVELFLNGESLGKQPMKRNSKLTWQVKYAPGTLSAKGFNDGKVVAEAKVETTGEPASVQLAPNRTTINADGEDVSVITVSVADAQGRVVPVASNKISFEISGAGKILGVGNGDPSCHEPDTFIPNLPVHSIAVNDWRWQLATVPAKGALAPEYANDFVDSSWNVIKPKTDGDTGELVLQEGQSAIYRAHVQLTEADLANPGVQIRFGGIDDHGWIFVNNQRVGESRDWAAQPAFDIKKNLHAGDNVIAVGVSNQSGQGGLNPDVNVELTGKPVASPWSRSVFNGLAQVFVQSTKEPGEIKLSASANGLKSATATITTQAGDARPSVP
ncbi:MAG TPA: beta-galactosidase GalA [Verrucomicrobiae bacterium]|nr:beta-galactosidase GalA [Verrucomicrobiae bacterium]